MPIYEYRACDKGCNHCRRGFDVLQKLTDEPLQQCPRCNAPVKRVVSRFWACVIESPEESIKLEEQLKSYEKEGMWSHAAEMADKAGLQERAMEDYKKAGYNF